MDLKMEKAEPTAEQFTPDAKLKAFIRRYWVVKAPLCPPSPKSCSVKPRGGLVLVFNLASPVRCAVDDQPPVEMGGDFLVGSLARRVRIIPTGDISLFGVEFTCYGLYPFLSMPPVDVADFCIQAEEVWELGGLGLSRRIHSTSQEDQSLVRAFESFITKRMGEFRGHSRMIEDAVAMIRSRRGLVRVEALASGLRVSSRHLERIFAYRIGVSPKQLCRIFRLKNALARLGEAGADLASLALEGGYFDQAHFIHEFRHFTGRAPLAYLRGN